ncbi:DUF1491 family protein [Alloyangia pacifica]|uniref:DUF1491 family protein n=1 Tax=Alloyangia pacifica TaxID=311180 RepID=UPI001CD4C878|nr:DUF1491 family protein [Alloyangia pacifica]MCA0997482.1 DUF1491 family protein [Alloyangia pacifica]
MPEPRLATHVWVGGYLRLLSLQDIPAYVTAHGDDTAGAVLVKLATLDGQAVAYSREWDLMTGARRWAVLAEGPEYEVDARVSKQREFDPDLWVIELEDRQGRHLLDQMDG